MATEGSASLTIGGIVISASGQQPHQGSAALSIAPVAIAATASVTAEDPLPEDVAALIDAMEVAPNNERTILYSFLISKLKEKGLWDKLQGLWIFAAHHEQAARLNIRDPGNNTATNNGCVFSPVAGFTGNASDAYLDLNFSGSALEQDDCHIGGWITGGTDEGGAAALIGHDPGATFFINPRNGNDRFTARVSSGSNSAFGDTSTIIGHFVAVRSGPAATAGYVDGELLGTGTEASAEAGDGNIRALAHTSPAQFADFTVPFIHCGAALDATEVADLHEILSWWLESEHPIESQAAVVLPQPTISATAQHDHEGTAALTIQPATIAAQGEGEDTNTGTGAISIAAPVIAAQGEAPQVGTATLTLPPVTIAAQGTHPNVASAAMTLAPAQISATGANDMEGVASLVMAAPSIEAQGTAPPVGTAAIVISEIRIDASAGTSVESSASLTVAPITISGTATQELHGSASLEIAPVQLSATARQEVDGVASIVIPSFLIESEAFMDPTSGHFADFKSPVIHVGKGLTPTDVGNLNAILSWWQQQVGGS